MSETKTPGLTERRANAILATSAAGYGLSVADLTGNRRTQPLARARQIAMFIMRHATSGTLTGIAAAVGRSDHTTVIHGVSAVQDLMSDSAFATRVASLARAANLEMTHAD